jgi:hypothetical protein
LHFQKASADEDYPIADRTVGVLGALFTIEEAKKIELDPILAERLDAFVSRCARYYHHL